MSLLQGSFAEDGSFANATYILETPSIVGLGASCFEKRKFHKKIYVAGFMCRAHYKIYVACFMCRALFIIHKALFSICRALFIICRALFSIYWAFCIISWVLFTI